MKHGTVCTICKPHTTTTTTTTSPPDYCPVARTSVPSPCSNTAACTFGSCKSWAIPATSYQRQNVVTGSSITHSTPSRIFLIISRNTGESCASPLVTVQDTIFLPFTSVTMCSLTNSRLEMTPFLTSSHSTCLIMIIPVASPVSARGAGTQQLGSPHSS